MSKAIEKIKDGAKEIIKKKNDEIVLLKTELKKANGEKVVSFKMPDTMEVRNFPIVQKVNIENGVNVLNLKDIKVKFPDVQRVQLISSEKEIIQKINLQTEKAETWAPGIALSIVKGIANMWARGLIVKLDDEERLKPLPVIMVDTKGRPINPVVSPSTMVIPTHSTAQKDPSPPTLITTGRLPIPTAGVSVQLPNKACKKVIITSLATNQNYIGVGNSAVSAQSGFENGSLLTPTGSVTLDIDNANKVWVDAATSGDVILYNILT